MLFIHKATMRYTRNSSEETHPAVIRLYGSVTMVSVGRGMKWVKHLY